MPTFEQKLKKFRKEIDGMDDKIIALISRRLKTANKIRELKQKEGKNMTDKTREIEILRKIEKKLGKSPTAAIVARIYKECFKFIKNSRPGN